MEIERSEILKRIKNIFKGLPQTKIAKICGVTHQAVNRYYRKSILPNYDAMLRIARYANVSMEWLLTGKESKELFAATVREKEAIYKIPQIIVTSAEKKESLQNQIYDSECISIPIISESVAAGDPLSINDKDIEGFICVHETLVNRGHTYRCLRVRGNSMHPIINDGFVIAIDLNENNPLELENKIVAARYNGRIAIRYLHLAEKEYVLLPNDTRKHKSIVIPKTKPNHIIGKVAWWWGNQK